MLPVRTSSPRTTRVVGAVPAGVPIPCNDPPPHTTASPRGLCISAPFEKYSLGSGCHTTTTAVGDRLVKFVAHSFLDLPPSLSCVLAQSSQHGQSRAHEFRIGNVRARYWVDLFLNSRCLVFVSRWHPCSPMSPAP